MKSIRRGAINRPSNSWVSIGRARLCTMAGVFTTGSDGRFINNACVTCSVGAKPCSKRPCLGAVRLPRAVLALIDRAFALRRAWRGHRLNRDDLAMQGLALSCELEQLVSGRFTYKPNCRLAKHILKHAMHWFWFLIDPTIAATNYRAEQAIRPAVVNRKVWGGNRTWSGARTQSILMSVLRTCDQRAVQPFDFLRNALCRADPQLLPP